MPLQISGENRSAFEDTYDEKILVRIVLGNLFAQLGGAFRYALRRNEYLLYIIMHRLTKTHDLNHP